MQNPIIDANAAGFQQLGWTVAKWFLIILLIALVLGLVIGLFTYEHPRRRKSKSDGLFDEVADFGVELSHLIIDKLFRRHRSGDWLSNQQILSRLRSLKPYEFEAFVGQLFSKMGYRVVMRGGSGDGGIDIELKKGEQQFVVQCKKYIRRDVTPRDVRDFFGAMVDGKIDGKGFFVTTKMPTLEAERWAENKPIEFIYGNGLAKLVREAGLVRELEETQSTIKQRTEICPRCGSGLAVRTNRKDGSKFFGCSAYPKCDYTKSI